MRRYKKPSTEDYKLKGWAFPAGFILLQDSREQRPLFNRLPSGLVVKSTALETADYSVEGFQENGICFERKAISDFISFCTTEREKTVIKMERMAGFDWAGLIIEADEHELFRPQQYSKVSPETLRQALNSFSIRYGIHIYLNSNREACARFLLDRATKYYCVRHEV
jgi:ERCC4-type nuclease